MDTPALHLEHVFQHVGERMALHDIGLTLPAGEWLLIMGPNGAGKSLLTRLLLGLDSPSAGTVRVLGTDLTRVREPPLRQLRRRIGGVLQGGSLLASYTVLENLLLPLRHVPMEREARTRAARLIMTLLQLDGLENHLPRALSLGQQRRVELGRALIHKPELLVWDGLSDGLDPGAIHETLDVLGTLKHTRTLTLFATDNSSTVLAPLCDRVAVLDRGQLLFTGTLPELEAASIHRVDLRVAITGQP